MNEFDKVLTEFLRKRFISDPEDLAAISRHAEILLQKEGGFVCAATFEKAYHQLRAAGDIAEYRGPAPVVQEAAPIDFTNMPVSEIRRRYSSDENFRQQYDASNGRGGGANVPRSAAEYNRLPVSETIRRYSHDPEFKRAVDQLIAEGKI
jgi:hypothetical protein